MKGQLGGALRHSKITKTNLLSEQQDKQTKAQSLGKTWMAYLDGVFTIKIGNPICN